MKDKQPDIAQIRRYLNGELDARAMHQLEKQAQGDPFLMDALEGYEHIGADQSANLGQLEQRLANRVEGKKRSAIMLWRIIPIAATILVFTVVGWFWLLKDEPNTEKKQQLSNALVAKSASGIARMAAPRHTTQMAIVLPPVANQASVRSLSVPHLAAIHHHSATHSNVNTRVDEPVGSVDQSATTSSRQQIAPTPVVNNPVATSTQPATNLITGKVTDAAGQTLPGVSVSLANGTNVVTDADGNFKIAAPTDKDSITIQMIGYQTKKIAADGNSGLNIKLQESTSSLAEVVIETKAIKTIPNPPHAQPEPLGGWKMYMEYIRQNAVMPDGQTGRVKLAFLVDTNGGISNIRVIRGRSEAMNQRAVAMIKNGPPWEGSNDDTVKKVKLKIRFRKS